jgi:hypothetical protein
MAGYLVYRSVLTDRNKLPYEIGGVLVNGASEAAAKAAAVAQLSEIVGPLNAAYVNNWTALQLDATDFTGASLNTVIQGAVIRPGTMLIGGGIMAG